MNTELIWEATLDDAYRCELVRKNDRVGTLKVTHLLTNQVLITTLVELSYSALFGPDVADVSHWQEMCVAAVDSHEGIKL